MRGRVQRPRRDQRVCVLEVERAPGRCAADQSASSIDSVTSCRIRRAPAGAERRAHRQLAVTRRAARQQQVRDVRARHEQHEPDRA